MKFVFLMSLFLCSQAFAVTNCEQVLREAYAENWLEKLRYKIFDRNLKNAKDFVLPEKVKWDEVYKIIQQNPLGTEKTSAWLSSFYERTKTGQTTFEETFAFFGIINPQRGLEVTDRLSKANWLRVRQKLIWPGPSVRPPWANAPRKTLVFPNKASEKSFNEFFISFVQATQPKDPWVLSYALRLKGKGAWDNAIMEKKLELRKTVDEARYALKQPVEAKLLEKEFGSKYEEYYQKAKEIGMLSDDVDVAFARFADKVGFKEAEKIWLETKNGLMSNGFWSYYWNAFSELTTASMVALPAYNYATDKELRDAFNNAVVDYYYQKFDEDTYFKRLEELERKELAKKEKQAKETIAANTDWKNSESLEKRIKQGDSDSFYPFDGRLLNPTYSPGNLNPQYPCDPEGKIYFLSKDFSEDQKKQKVNEFRGMIRPYIYTSDECMEKLKNQLKESDKLQEKQHKEALKN